MKQSFFFLWFQFWAAQCLWRFCAPCIYLPVAGKALGDDRLSQELGLVLANCRLLTLVLFFLRRVGTICGSVGTSCFWRQRLRRQSLSCGEPAGLRSCVYSVCFGELNALAGCVARTKSYRVGELFCFFLWVEVVSRYYEKLRGGAVLPCSATLCSAVLTP